MLRPHKPSKGEITNLFEIVERDLKDASAKVISGDWKFGIAYNAALYFAQFFSTVQAIVQKRIWLITELFRLCHSSSEANINPTIKM
jgi:hypothetical protein